MWVSQTNRPPSCLIAWWVEADFTGVRFAHLKIIHLGLPCVFSGELTWLENHSFWIGNSHFQFYWFFEFHYVSSPDRLIEGKPRLFWVISCHNMLCRTTMHSPKLSWDLPGVPKRKLIFRSQCFRFYVSFTPWIFNIAPENQSSQNKKQSSHHHFSGANC